MQLLTVILDGNARKPGLKDSHFLFQRRDDLGLELRAVWNDVQLGTILLRFALANLHPRPAALEHGKVGIACAFGGFIVPTHFDGGVNAAESVGDEAVAIQIELIALDVRRQIFREIGLAGYSPKLGSADYSRPAFAGGHVDVLAIINRLLRKEHPLNEVHQVSAGVGKALTLLVDV